VLLFLPQATRPSAATVFLLRFLGFLTLPHDKLSFDLELEFDLISIAYKAQNKMKLIREEQAKQYCRLFSIGRFKGKCE
jgi:hypothetical protein